MSIHKQMEKDLKNLIGAKVESVTSSEIIFDNGFAMEISPYDTYVFRLDGEEVEQ